MKIRAFKKQVREEANNIEITEISESVKNKANAIAIDNKKETKLAFGRKGAMALMLTSIAIVLIAVATVTFLSQTPSNNLFLSDSVARPIGSKANLKKLVKLSERDYFSFDDLFPVYKSAEMVDSAVAPTDAYSDAMQEASGKASETVSQVAGIQESEIIKCDSNHIYYANRNKVQIYEVNNGKATLVKELTLSNCLNNRYYDARFEYKYFTEINMYITDANLIVMYDKVVGDPNIYQGDYYYYYPNRFVSTVEVYEKTNFNLVKSISVPGSTNDGRVYNDYLYFVTTDSIVDYEIADVIETNNGITNINEFDYNNVIYVPACVDYPYENYICSLNLKTLESNYECQLGERSYGIIYMSKNALYLCNQHYDKEQEEIIYKYSLDENGFLKYSASGKVPGYALNQYSLDERNGYLRIVTTGRFNSVGNNGSNVVNAVYVLSEVEKNGGKVLEVAGKLDEGIGYPGEQVKSVKFNGEYVSIVTYRNTDPLYLIKFITNTQMEIVDYLKVPGYSTFLLDIEIDGVNYKLGVGYTDDFNYKLSLYKEENEQTTQVGKDYVIEAYAERYETANDYNYEVWTYNTIEIINNIRALFLFQDDNDNTFIGFNVDGYENNYYNSTYQKNGGYLLLRIEPDSEDGLVKFKEFSANSYSSRMVAINGYYYLVSLDQADGYQYNASTDSFDAIE